jgi:selenium metabolism protein YedF
MLKQLDLRGQACPLPVINSKKAVKAPDFTGLEIIVDNDVARDNVVRALKKQDCTIESVKEQGSDFLISVTSVSAGTDTTDSRAQEDKQPNSGTLADFINTPGRISTSKSKALFIAKDKIGTGNDELGALLMKAHLFTLTEMDEKPVSILLMNSGVKLAVEDSPCLANLQVLQDQGVRILVCGTCLDYFSLKEKCRVGRISNMYDITEALFEADNTIRI